MFYEVPNDLIGRKATGYGPDNVIAPFWDGPWDAFAGAGGLEVDTNLKFEIIYSLFSKADIRALLDYAMFSLTDGTNNDANQLLNEASTLSKRAFFMPAGENWRGLDWALGQRGTAWHNGGTAGFSTMLIVDPNNNRAVVAMSNTGVNRNVDSLAAMLIPI